MLYYALAALIGGINAIMSVANGQLTAIYGVYSATFVIHVVGSIAIALIVAFRRERVFAPVGARPWQYLGGVVGVVTTISNNIAFGRISLSAIIALGLLGQSVCSVLIDQFGLFGMQRRPFHLKQLTGLVLVLAGILVMLLPDWSAQWAAIIASLAMGVSIVVSRTLNASLAELRGVTQTTFYNHTTGLCTIAVVMALLGRDEPMFTAFTVSPNVFAYCGGLMGVLVVSLLSFSVSRISSFYMTLFIFLGQVFTGVVIDILLSGAFSAPNLWGGILVTVGLTLDLLLERSEKYV